MSYGKDAFLLNNVNHQILDLYAAHNILAALESRFVFVCSIEIRRQTLGVLFWCRRKAARIKSLDRFPAS